MPAKPENLAARQEFILHRLQETGSVAINDLCVTLGASIATIRRDLEALERRSLLRRTRGGAVPIGPLFYEPFLHDESFQDRVSSFLDQKRRIARAAAALVHSGDTVALSGGTTTTEVMRSLKIISGITIITNTVNVAMELSNHKDIEVVVTGGSLRGNWFTLVGPLATQAAGMLFADVIFTGVDGIDAERGLTCVNSLEAEFLRSMVRHSKKKVVVADHSKIGTIAKWLLCPASEIDLLITDDGVDKAVLAPFRTLGIAITLV